MYETDLTKGVYKLEDFCNALKDNNCIIDTKVKVRKIKVRSKNN